MASVAICAGFLGGCAGVVKTPSGSDRIDRTYSVTGFAWDSSSLVYVYVKARNKGGKTEVCGAYAPDKVDAFASQFNDRALESSLIQSDGTTLIQGVGFMNRLPAPIKEPGATSTCVVTSRPWEERFASGLKLRTSRGTFVD